MIDGEGHRRRRGDVGRIGDLLEIGLLREGQRKEQMIDDIERRCQCRAPSEPVDAAIGDEHADQACIFEGKRPFLANPVDHPAHHRREQDVGGIVDQEQEGQLVYGEAEMLDHHEGGKYHENLPTRPRHELQRVIEPVTASQDQPVMLRCVHREGGIGKPAIDGDGNGDAAAGHIDGVIAQPAPFEDDGDQPVGHKRGCRSRRHQPADDLRRAFLVDPLKLQRLVDRFVIVKADGADQRRDQQPGKAGEEGRHRDGGAERDKRQQRQRLFAHYNQHKDDPDSEESRDFADGLKPADLDAGEVRDLDREIVQQRKPGRKPERHREGHQEQQPDRAAALGKGLAEGGDKNGHAAWDPDAGEAAPYTALPATAISERWR